MPDEPPLWGYALCWFVDGAPQCTVHQVDDPDNVELEALEAIRMKLLEGRDDVGALLLETHADRADLVQLGSAHPAVVAALVEDDQDQSPDEESVAVGFIGLDGADEVQNPLIMIKGTTFIAVGLDLIPGDPAETMAEMAAKPLTIALVRRERPGRLHVGEVQPPNWLAPLQSFTRTEAEEQFPLLTHAENALLALACDAWPEWAEQLGERALPISHINLTPGTPEA